MQHRPTQRPTIAGRNTVQDPRQSSKVPAVTLGFWVIKIIATTLGETGGDTVSATFGFGYLVGTFIFLALLLALVWVQIRARAFKPAIYWETTIASTTAGTTMADFATRSMGNGYAGGLTLLFACVVASIFVWHRTLGRVSVESVHEPRAETFSGPRSSSRDRLVPPSVIFSTSQSRRSASTSAARSHLSYSPLRS